VTGDVTVPAGAFADFFAVGIGDSAGLFAASSDDFVLPPPGIDAAVG